MKPGTYPPTLEGRADAGRRLCRKLAGDVRELAPAGIGRWDPAWRTVSAATDAFLDTLAAWESTGSDALLPELRARYFAVLDAWRTAAAHVRRVAHV
jgi:hypothetical protein